MGPPPIRFVACMSTQDLPNTTATAVEPLFTSDEAARLLRVSRASLRRLIGRGEVPVVRVGVAIRLRRADLLAFMTPARYSPAACRDPRRHGWTPTGRPPRTKRARPAK
jgi:excisionase family DNA binding protein